MLYLQPKYRFLMFGGMLLAPMFDTPLGNLISTITQIVLLLIGLGVLYYGATEMFAARAQGQTGKALVNLLLMLVGLGVAIGASLGVERLSIFFDLFINSIDQGS